MKSQHLDNLTEDSLFTRMSSGVIRVGLVALIAAVFGVCVPGCKDAKDYYNQGDAYFKKGETDRAIAAFTKAIEKNPRFVNAYYYRGMAYHRKKDRDQAITDYTKAIEINPQFAVVYAERALIYLIKKEYDKAWEDVHKAEALGQEIRSGFREALQKASGRKK
ncbi:MAG: tetratricopeptide repeat protein [Planctomycetota bacterium]